jgi:peptide/nickel transport system permease protein
VTDLDTTAREDLPGDAGDFRRRRSLLGVAASRSASLLGGSTTLGLVGIGILSAMILFALVGPYLIGFDPNQQDLQNRLLPIWSEVDGQLHVLGTDPLGRDVFARLAVGARASLSVALAALVLGGGLGVVLGLAAGYAGGWFDGTVGRLIDAQLAIPNLVFAMIISASFGLGFWNTVLALGFSTWPIYARLLRGEVLRVKEEAYIDAARAVGVSTMRILRIHVLPNVINIVLVVGSLELGRMILVESSLSFVGLGMQPPDASWGSMIRQGQQYIYEDWRMAAIPGVCILLTVLGLNLVGDWLRDVLDPKSK